MNKSASSRSSTARKRPSRAASGGDKRAKQKAAAHESSARTSSPQSSFEHIRTEYLTQMSQLWQQTLSATLPPVAGMRFAHDAWQETPWHAFSASAYAVHARTLNAMVDAADVNDKTRRQLRFAVDQLISATSPANYLFSNPTVIKNILTSSGESLTAGVINLLRDLRNGKMAQSDENAFEIGVNIAVTQGAVIFENDHFQLLQYAPLTPKVYAKPLLIVPPCINKFYILDLQRHNSFVRYAVEQGHTVFMISWRNADASTARATWDDYIKHGVVQAIRVVQQIGGEMQINLLGFCIGGTLLSHALAWLAAHDEQPASSLTLLTTLLDFSDPGVLDVYIDELQLSARERAIGQGGLMNGRDFQAAFSALRPDDLVWNVVESNYLQGRYPRPFDLLYWNADSTNLPGPMFCWYLRNTYLENNLKTPGKLSIDGKAIDLGLIAAPTFIYGSHDDHIVPWRSAYASAALLNRDDPTRNHFVLGTSGHVAGVVNPPAANKRHHSVGLAQGVDADTWLDDATQIDGSWWSAWAEFIALHGGASVAAGTTLGNREFPPIEDAPGRYVKVKSA